MGPAELRGLLGSVALPSWMTAPDFERVRWLNRVVDQLFPHVAQAAEAWASTNVDALLRDNAPSWVRSIKMTRVSAGTRPPRITGVKVFAEEDLAGGDEVSIELELEWHSDAEFSILVHPVPKVRPEFLVNRLLDAATGLVLVKASVERISLTGRLRLSLRPLLTTAPVVGSVQLAFAEVPDFSFDLKIFNGNAAALPGLEGWLYGLITDSVLRRYTLPEKFVVPLIPEEQLAADKPRGVLEVECIEADGVPWMDLLSPSDPYVRLFTRSGTQRQVTTQIIENCSRPRWNERFMLLVHHPEAQDLTAILFDYDTFNQDDEIGRVIIPVRELPKGVTVDKWFPVLPAGEAAAAGSKLGAASDKLTRVFAKAFSPLGRKGPAATGSESEGEEDEDAPKGSHRPCRLHLRLTYLEFPRGEANRASADTDPATLSPAARRVLGGGVLYVRVRCAADLDFSGKTLILGGMRHKVKVKVLFGGQTKSTPAIAGRRRSYNLDTEIEFVVDADEVAAAQVVRFEAWDVHWRNAFLGAAELNFEALCRARSVSETLELRGNARSGGRLEVRCQWMGLLSPESMAAA
jgi:hypothetical protein